MTRKQKDHNLSFDKWKEIGTATEAAIRAHLGPFAFDRIEETDSVLAGVAAAHGGLVAVGALLRLISAQDETSPATGAMERWSIAVLRGVLRGEEGPIREDGRPYDGNGLDS